MDAVHLVTVYERSEGGQLAILLIPTAHFAIRTAHFAILLIPVAIGTHSAILNSQFAILAIRNSSSPCFPVFFIITFFGDSGVEISIDICQSRIGFKSDSLGDLENHEYN